MGSKRLFAIIISIFLGCVSLMADKSELHQRAEAEYASHHIASARSLYIRAFEGYVAKGQMEDGVTCGVKATALYYQENFWKEAFDLLRRIDQSIAAAQGLTSSKAALRYKTSKERMLMYMKMRKSDRVKDQLAVMEANVIQANNESLKNDLLYHKAIYYYTFGQTVQGNAVFKEMAAKLTAEGDYDKVDKVYKTLLANGRQSNNAGMLNQAYSSYMVWKDSVAAIKIAAERDSLNRVIANNEQVIADKDDSLSARQLTISGLIVLVVVLAVVLALGAMVLMRYVVTTRKQKKTIELANESNALKAKFIGNISSQLEPTLKKLDSSKTEVQALLRFSEHIQTLSTVENRPIDSEDFVDTQVQPLCESLIEEIRPKVKDNVSLTMTVPKMEVKLHKEYISYILRHLLKNAAVYTPAEGKISLDFKKRSPHTYQFLITNTGSMIPQEKREDVFKPFLEIKDLTEGDGLGLPICKQMASKMDAELDIDAAFTKGTRFVLNLHV